MADACYRRPFYTASFKGFSFEAEDASSEHGRRGAEGQFPFGEETAYADLGRHIRTYHIKGRFVTNDHMQQSGRFIAVCESPGPGTLVHPTRGAVRAACKKLKVSDKLIDGFGVTEVDCEFVEASDWLGSAVGAIITGLNSGRVTSTLQDLFLARYVVSTVAINQQAAVLSTASNAVGAVKRGFDQASGLSTDANVWRVSEDLETVSSGTVARNATLAWQAISNGIAAVDLYGSESAQKVFAHRTIINWASSQPASLTGTAGLAQEMVVSSMRILAGVALAKVVSTSPAANAQEACRQYAMVISVLREEATAARTRCDDDLHLALNQFIVETQTTLLARVYGTPAIVEYDFGGPVWSMVAAHEIYGDARRSRDIESINARTLPWQFGPVVSAVVPS